MSALKALNKLKKNKRVALTPSMLQLNNLKSSELPASQHEPIREDLKKLSNQVVLSMVSELSVPLNPLLSWFETSNSPIIALPNRHIAQSARITSIGHKNAEKRNLLLMQPLKSPPCKRCPALAGGICKCARKKFA